MHGMAVIVTSPDGHVQGCEADFDQSIPAGVGLDLEQVQVRRATIRLYERLFMEHCSDHIGRTISKDVFLCGLVMAALRKEGWRFSTRPIKSHNQEREE